jgi:hypothetical protein
VGRAEGGGALGAEVGDEESLAVGDRVHGFLQRETNTAMAVRLTGMK